MRSPSTRRAWIEILDKYIGFEVIGVALHPEGVDRNISGAAVGSRRSKSPSTRRAWIEIDR